MEYADEIALMSEDACSMNRLTKKLAKKVRNLGMEIKKTKTKVMSVQPTEDTGIVLEREIIEEAEWFEYLDSIA